MGIYDLMAALRQCEGAEAAARALFENWAVPELGAIRGHVWTRWGGRTRLLNLGVPHGTVSLTLRGLVEEHGEPVLSLIHI